MKKNDFGTPPRETTMTASEAFDRLQDADRTWRTLLDLQFGPLAFEARHNFSGRGKPGTRLRGAWMAREAALRAYHAAVTEEVSHGKRNRD